MMKPPFSSAVETRWNGSWQKAVCRFAAVDVSRKVGAA